MNSISGAFGYVILKKNNRVILFCDNHLMDEYCEEIRNKFVGDLALYYKEKNKNFIFIVEELIDIEKNVISLWNTEHVKNTFDLVQNNYSFIKPMDLRTDLTPVSPRLIKEENQMPKELFLKVLDDLFLKKELKIVDDFFDMLNNPYLFNLYSRLENEYLSIKEETKDLISINSFNENIRLRLEKLLDDIFDFYLLSLIIKNEDKEVWVYAGANHCVVINEDLINLGYNEIKKMVSNTSCIDINLP